MDKKIALITGATKGIGLAIARQLAAEGYQVIGSYVRDYASADLDTLTQNKFELKQVDVRDEQACIDWINQTLENYGRIDVLVNNAGITQDGLFLRMEAEAFDAVLDINLKGVFHMSKAVARGMLRQKSGTIINISSVVGLIGNAGQANYAASKAAVIGLSKSLAKEFASRNVRVNAIAPGFIETEMTAQLNEAAQASILNAIALKRFGQAEDIAHAVSFLASDKAKYITGQVLNVCGGMVI